MITDRSIEAQDVNYFDQYEIDLYIEDSNLVHFDYPLLLNVDKENMDKF